MFLGFFLSIFGYKVNYDGSQLIIKREDSVVELEKVDSFCYLLKRYDSTNLLIISYLYLCLATRSISFHLIVKPDQELNWQNILAQCQSSSSILDEHHPNCDNIKLQPYHQHYAKWISKRNTNNYYIGRANLLYYITGSNTLVRFQENFNTISNFFCVLSFLIYCATGFVFVKYCTSRGKRVARYIKFNAKYLLMPLFNFDIEYRGRLNTPHNTNYPGTLFVANHYNWYDSFIMFALMDHFGFGIGKHDLYVEFPICQSIGKVIFDCSPLIKYNKNQPNSGEVIKQNILDKLKNGHNVFIFPEGTSQIWGEAQEFKWGILNLCQEHKLNIQLVSINTEYPIGSNKATNMYKNYYQIANRRTKLIVELIDTDQTIYDNFHLDLFRQLIIQSQKRCTFDQKI